MAMLSNQDLIRRVPLFANLTQEQIDDLAANVTKRKIKKGEDVVRQGHNSNALFLILSGRAHVVMTDSKGKEVILATLKAGDYIGEMSLIDNEAHSATVQAETQMDVLVLGREDFTRCVTNNAAIAGAVMRGLVQRLRTADQKIVSLALMGVYGRVANVLLDMAEPIDKGEMLIREKVSRSDLSKMVGASREMVSRVMKDFEDQGFIKTNKDGGIRVWERRSKPR
ncbi:Crp/Fnr family transcriptional regulator [Rhodoferax mekongensis]|uniref:Crp/Fnr family transcriptional regulator n=1 Tax=Rhodoferax mekongensis TaxID=3068341 RepID=A0ABZ0B3N3_9BURK|nr:MULTISPECIES: Crp/Fnr family transcriptional regulator [unclassified Rhodoferax]MDT7516254.1 Crp/Fnr family transcriptional regulator [Rhodoferax sp. TBRC 17199]NBX20877.1 Crp/Fnr family transcriptional regulator [Betaproteobacteria bacterium]WNO06443.1 Crp/Fnr family transcriptional regulator [Rhodoferax sp. TBRC 17307]